MNHNKTLSCLTNEENKDESPSFHHFTTQLHENLPLNSHPTHFDPQASPLLPQSPESSWSYSPLQTPSYPSLLFCCISSLHRDGNIYSIAVSGDLVFTGSNSRRVHAWQSLSSDCHAKGYINANSGDVRVMVTYSNWLFTSHKDHKIRVWNIRSNNGGFKPRKVTTLPYNPHLKSLISKQTTQQHEEIISCMAYYHIEGILYSGSFDRTIKAWSINDKKCIDTFIAHGGNVNDMVINQLNGYLFSCSSDGTVKIWLRVYGETSHTLIKVLCFLGNPIHALAISMSQLQKCFLYSGSSDGSINFWEQQLSYRYNHRGVLQEHQFGVLCLVVLENFVISGSEDSTIRIWRRQKRSSNHNCLAVLEGHRGPITCLGARVQLENSSAMSFLVYSGSLDQTFKVWRVKLLQEIGKSPLRDEDMEGNEFINVNHKSPLLSPSWVKMKKQLHSCSVHKDHKFV
ncbi:unnamed protein product [Amaranthus hypochondriacus]